MSFDVYISLAYAAVCIAASFVLAGVRKQTLPAWSSVVTSVISMLIWSLATRKSKLTLVQISALFDVVGALAYFAGFVIIGETVTGVQCIGIILMVFSIFLINS
jgi:drug/metabolite transporter (DMT)-like permease